MNLREELEQQDRLNHYAGIRKEYYIKGRDGLTIIEYIKGYYPELYIADDVEEILHEGGELQLFLDTGNQIVYTCDNVPWKCGNEMYKNACSLKTRCDKVWNTQLDKIE